MTGPATGALDRRAAPTEMSATRITPRGPISTILVLLVLGFALRVIIAYLLPGSGFGVDLTAFRFWAHDLATNGPFGFYSRPFFHDYTPGYLLVLWVVGLVERVVPAFDLIKVPAILADLVGAYLIWAMTLEIGASRRAALVGAGLYLFVPITWFDSVVWGQVDSVGVVFVLLGLRDLWRDRPERATAWAVVAAVVKPQLGILVPIVAAVLIRRYLWDPMLARRTAADDGDGSANLDSGRSRADEGASTPLTAVTDWFRRERGPARLVSSAIAGLATVTALCLPFGIWIPGLIGQIQTAAGGYPYLTVNAYNPWALLSRGGAGLAASGEWLCDAVTSSTNPNTPCPPGSDVLVAGIPAVAVGTTLLLLATLAIFLLVAWRPDRLTILVGVALLALTFFVLPTRVHERYLFPFFTVAPILAAVSLRWRWAYAGLAVAVFLNMYVVLTTLYPGNPQISDWLGIGGAIRSTPGVTIIALINLAGFAWVATELRPGAARALARAIAGSHRVLAGAAPLSAALRAPGAAGRAVVAGAAPERPITGSRSHRTDTARLLAAGPRDPLPAAPDVEAGLGWLGPLRRRLLARPLRADRSRGLHEEPTGRLDRLDAWLLVVLVVSSLGLRMWRLDEPESMHFDEVYHARTATEFLQDWRYGQPHAIYEFTHPHLAKYAMAAGIIAWANDRVTATSNLGVPIRDAIVERRWDDPTLPDHRAGDRFYVATGSEVRSYDLQTRALLTTYPIAGATALAIDPSAHRLFIGTTDGKVLELDTTTGLDPLRIGSDARTLDPPAPFGTIGGAVQRLFATDDGSFLIAIRTTGDVVSLDGGSGELLGTAKLTRPADIASAGTSGALVAHPAEVTDAAGEAATLAGLIGGDAATYRTRLGATASQVVLGGTFDADTKASVEKAIADGRLTGLSFDELPVVAVADGRGVTLLNPSDMSVTDEVPIAGGATGLAATTGLDAPRLYAAGGSAVVVVKLAANATEQTPPSVETTIKMPSPVSRVTFDPASVLVHVLGAARAGDASTIYVIEPHAQSVFADAQLPFIPAAWATDVTPDLPSADREQIVTLAADGAAATVDIGHHEFSWRMPGVIAGAISAGLLYLLARILFRRRSIGVLVAIFSLVDGMLFVQSRIAMNDVYVGMFLLGAYVLFAALWMGVWRHRAAFWVVMPIIGLLLGLALASKWVAAYAIAAIALLMLVRSALGRLVSIIGLILATSVLGYQAIVVNHATASSSQGDLTFLLIMIALTITATVINVLHPIAWSTEEVRLAVAAPAGLGIVFGLVAIPLAGSTTKVAVGPTSSPSMLLLTAGILLLFLAGGIAALFAIAARLGFGPLAPPPDPDDPIRLPPAAPAPTGWLRPGAMYGLPIIWAGLSLVVIPVAVYVISYIPWALNSGGSAGSPQIFPAGTPLIGNWPPGHTGQTLLGLTQSMYDYHNNLRATHAASSPWWAWPFDLKPVWFYQGSFAGNTSAAIYDAGNLVIWWLGVPGIAFAAWQAFRRQSIGLALVTVAFAFQWLSWARIDRATFQYHYYTSVPFIIIGLAYLLAELWHGASMRTWLMVRLAAAVAVMGPGLLWLFKGPLCTFVDVDRAYANSPACHGNPGDFVLTYRTAGLALVVVLGLIVLIYQVTHLETRWQPTRGGPGLGGAEAAGARPSGLSRLLISAGIAVVAVVAVSAAAGDEVLLSIPGFQILPLALIVVGILAFVGWFVATARDARRFVAGAVFAAVGAFLIMYPNIAALPLPSTVFNAYQGLLPTYLYPFQFPVNTDEPVKIPGLLAGDPNLPFGLPGVPTLAVFLTITCVIVGYAAWSWRLTLAERGAELAGDDAHLRSTG